MPFSTTRSFVTFIHGVIFVQYLQYKGLTIERVAVKLTALKDYLREERENVVNKALQKAKDKTDEYDITIERCVRFTKRMDDETNRDLLEYRPIPC